MRQRHHRPLRQKLQAQASAGAHGTGVAGRARAVSDFGWDAIADQTIAVYEGALQA